MCSVPLISCCQFAQRARGSSTFRYNIYTRRFVEPGFRLSRSYLSSQSIWECSYASETSARSRLLGAVYSLLIKSNFPFLCLHICHRKAAIFHPNTRTREDIYQRSAGGDIYRESLFVLCLCSPLSLPDALFLRRIWIFPYLLYRLWGGPRDLTRPRNCVKSVWRIFHFVPPPNNERSSSDIVTRSLIVARTRYVCCSERPRRALMDCTDLFEKAASRVELGVPRCIARER